MKTLIWDLDGTLVDSYKVITDLIQKLFKPYRYFEIDEIYKEIIERSVGQFFIDKSRTLNIDLDDIHKAYQVLTKTIEPSEYPLIKDAKEVLETLKSKGYNHMIYTHRGLSTYAILKETKVEDLFDDIITSHDGFKRKPDPHALYYLIDKHKLDKEITYYIGDRSLDVACGNSAGLHTIYVGPEKDMQADHHVEDLLSLLDLL